MKWGEKNYIVSVRKEQIGAPGGNWTPIFPLGRDCSIRWATEANVRLYYVSQNIIRLQLILINQSPEQLARKRANHVCFEIINV